ncbi:MAG TPA: AAA family ATPase [Candidatus Caccovicinus merdipullorum]|uniref:AAA family ATPase n=1 Tax=Candidatus Caccovicinus merdipullorum TaxID=2840724 RepID=A0A9D1KFM9_9FIRM|nr:AAA family ATPase [Candidatus Caccovicinus merdipullorum]
MDTWKMVKAAMPGPPCWETDWEILSSCGLTGFFGEMEGTMQNPRWHGEKDVMTHTRMVCDALAGLEEFRSLSEKVRHEVFLAALLHDIGKIPCTRLEDGQWTSPNHGRVGSRMVREFLWREWEMAGEADLQALRECVCLLIRFHMVPGHILRRKDGERTLIQISAWGEAAPDFSLKLLHLLAEADLRGRICEDTEEKLLEVELSRQMARDAGCFEQPALFPSEAARRDFFRGRTDWPGQELYDDAWGEVVVLCGLPGTGKDTWISRNLPGLPCISLDEIRKKQKISPTNSQGQVIGEARKLAREYLRKKQPFVWNATSLNSMTRDRIISLAEQYHGAVRLVYLETGWDTGLARNRQRKEEVPEAVIGQMLSRLEPPGPDEARRVEWHCV